jgi:GDP-L-fucose synthase
LRKFHEAKEKGTRELTLWGSGTPKREFLHADDLASACLYLLETYDSEVAINVGTGEDVTIKGLAENISEIVGFSGQISWDLSKPDGTPRKLLDVSRINAAGWHARIRLEDGLRMTYDTFKETLK